MAKNKTTETDQSVAAFVSTIGEEKKRRDFAAVIDLITTATGLPAKMWGTAIVGFGSYDYTYESGREGSAPLVGIAARANAITFYLSANFDNREELLSKLGKHKTGKGCIYIQRLEDIDTSILIRMVKNSLDYRKKHHS